MSSPSSDHRESELPLTSTHWGNYRVEVVDGEVRALHPFEIDADPSPIGPGIVGLLDGPTRVTAPMVRRSWLEHGPGAHPERRGNEPFVEVSWDEAERLVAGELDRVRTAFGNEAIFAGSYGWASAGRFHHAQSQLKRFLNCIGGFTRSVNSYSFAAGEVITPFVLGDDVRPFAYDGPAWSEITENAELVVAFGGVRVNNGQIIQGGGGSHIQRESVAEAAHAGLSFVNVSPLRSDIDSVANAEWVALRPSTDTALLLGLAHTLVANDLVDRDFVDTYTVGFAEFEDYLQGRVDGVVKSAEWASTICDLDPQQITALATRMATSRTVLSMSWSLTRQQFGEHVYWAAVALAALIGQIGRVGQGVVFGLSSVNTVGLRTVPIPAVALPQGTNPVDSFIPVARITDLLTNPGGSFDYNGSRHEYPETKLIWWAGGNPFHHHQDLNRMRDAWRVPETIVVNEWCWNSMAKHADIVLPCTTTLERFDLSATFSDPVVAIMTDVVAPAGSARNDHDIFAGIAEVMGVREEFTGGRTDREWVEHLYDETRRQCAEVGVDLPTFEKLSETGWARPTTSVRTIDPLVAFRNDPIGSALGTPSGKIELFSEQIAGFELDGFPGHPAWNEPTEWLGNAPEGAPLHIITNQPIGKLHSQMDHGSVSAGLKVDGREPLTIHPDDAAARGIADRDVVMVGNTRGSCFAVAVLDDRVRQGVVQMATGAWYDPVDPAAPSPCKHGNPNVFTADIPTSGLSQGCSAHTCMVDVERFDGEPPTVTAFEPPTILDRSAIA